MPELPSRKETTKFLKECAHSSRSLPNHDAFFSTPPSRTPRSSRPPLALVFLRLRKPGVDAPALASRDFPALANHNRSDPSPRLHRVRRPPRSVPRTASSESAGKRRCRARRHARGKSRRAACRSSRRATCNSARETSASAGRRRARHFQTNRARGDRVGAMAGTRLGSTAAEADVRTARDPVQRPRRARRSRRKSGCGWHSEALARSSGSVEMDILTAAHLRAAGRVDAAAALRFSTRCRHVRAGLHGHIRRSKLARLARPAAHRIIRGAVILRRSHHARAPADGRDGHIQPASLPRGNRALPQRREHERDAALRPRRQAAGDRG